MTETTKMRIAVTLYRMYDVLINRNTDVCFIADFDDFMTPRDNEYIKKYLRHVGCLLYKVRESHFCDSISAEWKVDVNVFKSLLKQYDSYISDYDKYNETLSLLRTKTIKHNDKDVVSKKKHLSEASQIFTSKHRCKYYINNVSEVYNIVKKRYPFWDDIHNKINYINNRNIGIPKIKMDIKVTHSNGIVSKVSTRYSNCLVSMKAHEVDAYGNTERSIFCNKNGLYYSFDVNASIHRLTYMLNHNGDEIDGDVYEVIFRKAFPDKPWNDDTRRVFKTIMMRNYFDTSARNAAKNYINNMKKEGRNVDVELARKVFDAVYPALREVEGKTFDNEIFFWESIIMINLIYEMMQKYNDIKVFSVYDGIYFNKPIEAEVAEMWKSIAADVLVHYYYKLDSAECKNEESVVIVPSTSRQAIFSQKLTSSKSNGSTSLYPLTDKHTFSLSVANNNNAQVSALKLYQNHCILTMLNGYGSSIKMVESRRKNASKGKGIKHDSINMKGIKHDSTNMKGIKHDKISGVLAKIKELGLVNITDRSIFVMKAEKLGIKKRTAYSWFNIINDSKNDESKGE